jgi:hypothetical protein
MSDRYDDKPFLRYVDAWVLNAIGHLDDATRAYCVAMEPTLRQSLGLAGNWTAMVEKQMKFAPECRPNPQDLGRGKVRFEAGNGRPADRCSLR